MKKIFLFSLIVMLALSVVMFSSCGSSVEEEAGTAQSGITVENESYYAKFRGKGISLNVYNWGEYISDGSDKSIDVIKEFENISGIKVNYTMYDSNEDMYPKLVNSGAQYDIVIPSDYMVARLIDEGRLEKLNYENIPNIKHIDPKYHMTDFDPNGEYSVPYTWGMVGIIYNKKHISAQEASSWDVLWNEKNKGKVLMFGNSRDAFGIALFRLGYDINTNDIEQIEQAADTLIEQKKISQAYAMDQTFDKMKNENAWAAPYYAGDCANMMDDNPNLAFSYPKEGTNLFIDSICIPKGTKNKAAAEAFINFLCETDIAVANCEYIEYFTPHTAALEVVGYDERIYPTDEVLATTQTFKQLEDEPNHHMEILWLKIKATSSFDNTLYPLAIILLLGLVIFLILYVIRKHKKDKIDY